MASITARINVAEQDYYVKKYGQEGLDPNCCMQMARISQLANFTKIPDRMQYWAAQATFGGPVRYSMAHVQAVDGLQAWANMHANIIFNDSACDFPRI